MTFTQLTFPIAGWLAVLAMAVVGFSWLSGISRNPQASGGMFVPGVIALAMCEFVALLAFVITLIS